MSVAERSESFVPAATRRVLRVLMVEDSPPDALLLERALQRGGFEPQCERVDTPEMMERALRRQPWDLILADHSMPHFSAPEALALLKNQPLDIPFIIVSGHIDEETAVRAMRAGAHDYIMKERLARLVPAVERELREAAVRRERDRSEAELRRAHEELELRVEKRTADLKATNLKLQNVIEERKRLENELLDIAENERRRIGLDLHDDLGQKLTGVSMMIKGLEQRLISASHPCERDTRKIRLLLDDIIRHTHNLAREFSSLDVNGDDLPSLLRGLAENVNKMFSIPCGFEPKGAIPALPEHTALQLYKIAQEAVSNAIKHGKASQVSLGLTRTPVRLILSVKNDGLPFSPPNPSSKRMGLRIMNYRANTIGGLLEIKPVTRSGTLVTCTLVLRDEAKNGRRLVTAECAMRGAE